MSDGSNPGATAESAAANLGAPAAGAAAPEAPKAQAAPEEAGVLGRGTPPQDDGAGLPEWMGGLPDELKSDATLTRFKSLEDLARGHVEAHRVAKSKVVLPKEGDAEGFGRFAASVRPDKAEDYQFSVPEGQTSSLADAMRQIFHDAGLHPESARRLVDGWNTLQAEQSAQAEQKGKDELAALAGEMGQEGFAKGKQAAVNMLNRLGIPSDFEDNLSRFIGGGNTLRLLFDMAGRMGELGRVDPVDIKISTGQFTPGEAAEEARRMIRDKEIAPKLAEKGSAEKQRYDELVRIASAGS